MLRKLVAITLMGGLMMTSCKKKEADLPVPVTAVTANESATHAEGLHVCVEKNLPTSQYRTEAAIYTSSQWQTGQTIRIKFLNGDAALQTRVKNAAATWLQYANLKFQYVGASENADIKIAFRFNGDQGSWSYFGKECRYIAQNQPSMNFGWFNAATSEVEIGRTTLHEFGHALGLIHEQSSPGATINWNKEAVYAYYTGAPNYWTRADVDNNVFAKFSASQSNYTAFDKWSIMLYAIPAAFTTDGLSVGNNTVLSATDKSFIGQRYPFTVTQKTVLYAGEKLSAGQSLTSPDNRLKMTLQANGELVLLKNGTQVIWSSNTAGKPVTQLVMQGDGNLVLYDNALKPYWHSGTYSYSGAFLQLENTGSAVIYQNGIKRWTTNTTI